MANENPTLVLDVDGTFLKTDMLLECFWGGMGKDPLRVLSISLRHFTNPAVLKRELAEIANLRTDLLPVHPEIKAHADEAMASGRKVVLASASDEQLVSALARDHGLSEQVFASDGDNNLKGGAKARALTDAYGAGGFDYAGNENTDLAIWDVSKNALIVGDVGRAERSLAADGKPVIKFPGGWAFSDALKAMRPHQWVKNVLLILPMLAAHDFTAATLALVLLGMIAFSFAASCIYIVNDLLDLEADRLHATKCRRPFASGAVPIGIGMLLCGLLGIVALGLGSFLGLPFFLVVAGYMVLSLAYSLRLKRVRWVDIAILAALYTLRVVAGAAAGQVEVSGFMLVFIFPIFITLGCVKRLTELTLANNDERLPGRGYGRADRGDLLNVAWIGFAGALVTFFLYTMSEQAIELYPTRWLLWAAMIPIAMWLIRMIRLGYFGKQDYDPIVFALRDKRGIGLLLITLSMMFYAAGLWQGF
ncbi:MAG: UbiA family prenyltransferase [Marinosulfonomonas sp.]|nr:UbiA family prenyltransferase [Marinosulfonomonas sp.]